MTVEEEEEGADFEGMDEDEFERSQSSPPLNKIELSEVSNSLISTDIEKCSHCSECSSCAANVAGLHRGATHCCQLALVHLELHVRSQQERYHRPSLVYIYLSQH